MQEGSQPAGSVARELWAGRQAVGFAPLREVFSVCGFILWNQVCAKTEI